MRRTVLSSSLLLIAAAAAPAAETIVGFVRDDAPAPVNSRTPIIGGGDQAPTLVVTADRQESSVERTTATVDVVDNAERRLQGHPLTASDALRDLPGVDAPTAGGLLGTGSTIRLRGTGTTDTRILVDGIPVGDPSTTNGTTEFNSLDPAGLDRIEVVRGPQSSLYGSGAVGGVVNLLTVRPTATPRIGVRGEAGSFTTAGGEAVATGPLSSRAGYALAVGGMASAGFSSRTQASADGRPNGNEEDGVHRGSASARLEAYPTDALTVYAAGRAETLDQEYDTAPNDDASDSRLRRYRGAVGGEFDLGRAVASADAARTTTARDYDSPGFSGTYRGVQDYAALRVTGEAIAPEARREAFDRLALTAGADLTRDRAEATDNFGTATDEGDRLHGVWGQVLLGGEHFELSESARRDFHSREGGAGTWRSGAAAFLAGGDVKIHGSIGRSFRAPTLSELYDPFYGDPDLRPARSIGMDLGHVTQLPGDVTIENTWFRTAWSEDIGFDPSTFQSMNTDGYRVEGLESAMSLREGQAGFRLRAAWTAQRTDLDEAEIGAARGFTYLPKNKVAIRPSWHHDRGFIAVRLEAVGRRTASTFSARPEMAGYALVSASAGYVVTKGWEVYARGENLGNTAYELNPGYATTPIAGYLGVAGGF